MLFIDGLRMGAAATAMACDTLYRACRDKDVKTIYNGVGNAAIATFVFIDLARHSIINWETRTTRRNAETSLIMYLCLWMMVPQDTFAFTFHRTSPDEAPQVTRSDGRVMFSYGGHVTHGERFAEVSIPISLAHVHEALDAVERAVDRYAEYYSIPKIDIHDHAAMMDALSRGYYEDGGSGGR